MNFKNELIIQQTCVEMAKVLTTVYQNHVSFSWRTLCPSWEQETAMIIIPHVLGALVFIFQSGGVECSSKLSSHFHAAKGAF
jgi:hypothetical protein